MEMGVIGMRDFRGMMEMFRNWTMVMVAQLCKFVVDHCIVHLK